ncbi:GlcNAc-transferase family protein [Micromonospora carbonacea]|uniref:GlcNAc-transferase family protein n=1 Tax=Micromonospora carbonacea TaxID=47853 RepID=UPI003D75E62E
MTEPATNRTIFVSVASYRDPELVATVQDCLAKADRPDRLRIGVNWQHADGEDVSALRGDARIRIVEFDAAESRGACWARAEVMRLYDGEDHFLQIDSHTRFAPGWDSRVLRHAAATGAAKPIVTSYLPAYEPGTECVGTGEPTVMVCESFTDDGIPLFGQRAIDGWRQLAAPPRARFVSAHFLFAPGSFVAEVPYDPRVYFMGEEISLTVRAYTWGYDLFHLPDLLAWHYYLREEGAKHWTDHTEAGAGKPWWARDRASRRRVVTMLRNPTPGPWGCGPARTVADYERYAGIGFRSATSSPECRSGAEPSSGAPVVAGAAC